MTDEIRRGTSRPVYVQLAAILRERIRSGAIQPGYPIPSKRALYQEFAVADGTVNRALGILREAGMVETVQGLGVFVTEQSRWRAPPG